MREIPRGLIILKPKQPFVDWLNSWCEEETELSLEEARRDPDVFLIPEFESDEEAMRYVRSNAGSILQHALADWCANEDLWPVQPDFVQLDHWFEIGTASVVFDAVDSQESQWDHN